MEKLNLSLAKLDDIQNHEDFRVIWLSLDDVPNSMNFADYLNKYNSYETCINDIKNYKGERKILLVLTMNLEYLSIFENLSQIQSIYILREENEYFQLDKENHSKLVDIFTNLDELINRLRKDILLNYINDFPMHISSLDEFNIEQSLTSLYGNCLTLLWNQTFIYYLINQPNANTEKFKKIMLDRCRLEYNDNQCELTKINDFFINCSQENILNWYTKDSFLYRLLNKAFRTRNIHFICEFQYFLINLYQKFKQLSKNQNEIYPLTVYRGQIINTNELNRLQFNVGRFISINTIMSTSRLENVARSFMLGAKSKVLFKITINDTINNNNRFRPYIDIREFSSMQDEQEILFFVGTIFSIFSVEQENDSTWTVELILNNEIYEHIEDLIYDFQINIDYIKSKHYLYMKTDDYDLISQYYYILTGKRFYLNNLPINMIYIHTAFIFSNLGCYEKAIDLYKKSLVSGNISIDSPQFIVTHIIIGYLYYHFYDCNNAFIHYGIALSLLGENDLLIVELYNHIGDVWDNINNIDNAISCYQQALSIANINQIAFRSDIYLKINDLNLKTEHAIEDSVNEHYRSVINPKNETSLKSCQNRLNNEHNLTPIERIDLFYESGIYLMRKGDYLQALQVFLKTKQMVIEQQLDDANNPTTIRSVDLSYQIGLALMKKGDFSQALESLLQAAKIIIKNPPSWERFPQLLSTLYDNIATLYFLLCDPLNGIITWKKSIDVRTNFSYQ